MAILKLIANALGQIGLKENDIQVFLACMHFKGGLYIHEIVKQTKIKRSTVDHIIDRLLDEGYLTRLKVGRRYKYFAQKPEALLFQQERILENFKDIMPVLARLGSSQEETDVRFFEGAQGLQQIYDDILIKLKMEQDEARKELLGFSSGAHLMRILPDFQERFVDKRIKMGARFRAIAPESSRNISTWSNDPSSLREVKYFDETLYPFSVSVEVYGDSVTIYSAQKPVGGVVISNKKIAESLRSLFYLVWGLLPSQE